MSLKPWLTRVEALSLVDRHDEIWNIGAPFELHCRPECGQFSAYTIRLVTPGFNGIDRGVNKAGPCGATGWM